MFARFGNYLFPSLMMHGAFFAALAGSPSTVESSPRIDVIEFTTITDNGGGRMGDDTQIGDATEPTEPPEKMFREVKPKPKPERKRPIAQREPEESPAATAEGEQVASTATDNGAGVPASHSLVMGSAGSNPNATQAGVGSGDEGVDRRSALRAWLREIQREVNKIATRNYPSSAVRMKLEGQLKLGITIGTDGGILGVRVLSSSGHSVLDDSAAESVMALHIPAPPDALGWREREVSLPIRYALQ